MQTFIVSLSFVVAGLGVAGWGLRLLLLGQAAKNWPVTTGEIIESGIKDYNEPSNYGYSFHVKYTYSAHGSSHTGTRLQFGLPSYLNKDVADSLARQYAVGEKVPVIHHPRKPLATLQPGYTESTLFLILLGSVTAIIGAWIFLAPSGR